MTVYVFRIGWLCVTMAKWTIWFEIITLDKGSALNPKSELNLDNFGPNPIKLDLSFGRKIELSLDLGMF